jgi:hypothetical protein
VIVLDTTVLVYAKCSEHPLRRPCRRLVEGIADGVVQATTTVEVIQEFVHVRARRRGRADAAELGSDYAELLNPLMRITYEDLRRGLDLYERADALDAFDAVLAGAALGAGAPLVSADRAFAEVPQLEHLIPDEPAVNRLLTGRSG